MVLTNKLNLPADLIKIIENDPYDSGDSDISVTRLINPLQMEALKWEHRDAEAVEDVSEKLWALIGQATHYLLEQVASKGDRVEERLFWPIDGWIVSGQFDKWENNTLTDYKITSVYSGKDAILHGKPEWTEQLNLLAALCDLNDLPTEKSEILAIFRDWSKFGGRRDPDYPPPAALIPIELLSKEERLSFLFKRVREHQDAREGHYPPCTQSQMWERPTTYAVMKEGRKSALRVLDTMQDALSWVETNKPKGKVDIVLRPGERVRCENYCQVRDVCQQYAEYKG